MRKKLTEEEANALRLRATTIKEKACRNCGGNVMTKWKYGQPESACMTCGFDPEDMTKEELEIVRDETYND